MADKLTCTLLTDCLFLQKSRPTCHNRPIGNLSPPSVGWLTVQESEKYSSQNSHLLLLHLFVCMNINCEEEEEEELHGKLEEDRFLFSLENNSAACDVLDLREVLSVFLKEG